MSKLESLVKRYEFIKKMWVNSTGTSEQSQWEAQLNQIIQEMEKWQTSHRNNARIDYGAQVMTMYHLYENGLKTPENTKED